MYRISKEKKAFVLFLSLFFLSILTITIDYNGSGVFGFFEDLGMSAYKPINQSFNTVVNKIKEYSFLFAKIEDLQKENEILKNEKKVFLQENSIAREKAFAYDRLIKMFQFKEYYSYEMMVANIVGREPANWFHSITIDRGINDEVENDMGVANYKGLVGKIVETKQNNSQVLLLIDQGCSVGAMVQRTREIGVIKGGPDTSYCYLDYISHDADIKINDIVVTSGMGSTIPKGIPIGQVVAIQKEKHDLFQRILVKPEVDFNKLEEVFIVKNID